MSYWKRLLITHLVLSGGAVVLVALWYFLSAYALMALGVFAFISFVAFMLNEPVGYG